MITDGNPTTGNRTSQHIIDMVNNFTENKDSALKRMILFVYALGAINNTEYLRNLTCEFNGIVLTPDPSIKSTSPSVEATNLQNFYKYLSVGVTFTEPIWTEPYIDYYTGAELVTVSMPAYYTNRSTNLTTLFAVAGIDIVLEQFNRFGYSKEDIVVKLIGESACQVNKIDQCKLQILRGNEYECPGIRCPRA